MEGVAEGRSGSDVAASSDAASPPDPDVVVSVSRGAAAEAGVPRVPLARRASIAAFCCANCRCTNASCDATDPVPRADVQVVVEDSGVWEREDPALLTRSM